MFISIWLELLVSPSLDHMFLLSEWDCSGCPCPPVLEDFLPH